MKKKVAIIILLLLTMISSGVLYMLYRKNQNIDLIKNTFQFEYGEIIHLQGKDVLHTDNTSVLNTFEADYSNLKLEKDKKYPKVGSYKIQITYKFNGYEKKENIEVIVKDTKEPVFTKIPDKIEVHKGYDAKDLDSYFAAKDLSPVDITVNTKNLDTDQAGEYDVEVSAIDKYKNKNVKKVKVIVIEDEIKEPGNEEKPDVNPDKKEPNDNIVTSSTPYTISSPRYVNGIMIVNKKNPVPYNYTPYENAEAGNQVRSLIQEMQNSGYDISSSYSGFRSFDTQAGLYQNYVNNYGQAQADTFSARPGYSEHQTGLAFDLLHTDGSLVEKSREVNWIAQNAHRYGFIVRYKAGKEHITGYQAEPWHIRYIGSMATDVYNSGLTLEEYLGVEGGSY